MPLIEPDEHSATGALLQKTVLGGSADHGSSLYQQASRDFVFAEIWTRPGLDQRARFLISIAGTACEHDEVSCARFAEGALKNEETTLSELREAALQVAIYGGWAAGGVVDRAVSTAAKRMSLPEPIVPPLRAAPWDPVERLKMGAQTFEKVAVTNAPPPFTPYLDAGVLNFVMGELWTRDGLDERARRWLTLTCAGFSGSPTPMRSHSYSAMASGNVSKAEILEFILQFSVHAGWPRGATFQSAVMEQVARVEKGLPFEP